MINNFWFIGDKSDFQSSRAERIGASDVPALYSNPESPAESLAGYRRTALTVYQEKRGLVERDHAGRPAEKGHHDENKSLEWTIRGIAGYEYAVRFRIQKERYESAVELAELEGKKPPSARDYQIDGPFLHSVEYYTDGVIVHPDCLYVGNAELKGKDRWCSVMGIKIDLSKPFLIEAKSARMMAAKRRTGTFVKGYDFNLSTWQGIPLKHYFQVQFQMSVFRVNTCLLALIYDTSDFNIWSITADRKRQGKIIDRVGRMVKHIKDGTMPRELAINTADVIVMVPDIEKDFISLGGDRKEKAVEAAKTAREADKQEKAWKRKKEDAKAALAVMLDGFEEIRDGSKKIASWTMKKGSVSISKPEGVETKGSVIDWMKKEKPAVYRMLEKNGMIKVGKPSRYVSVKWKDEED